MSLTNPHRDGSTFQLNQPANLPRLPFEKPTSDVGKEAAKLHRAAQRATDRLREVRDAQADAATKLTNARQALQAEVVRGARDGIDQEREHELSLELAAAERLADGETHMLRQRVAVSAQREAVRELNVYLWDHVIELLDAELRHEAEAASAELVEALATIAPAQERYRQAQDSVYELLRITAHGEHAQAMSKLLAVGQEPAPPLPSDEAVETFERARHAPELVALDAD